MSPGDTNMRLTAILTAAMTAALALFAPVPPAGAATITFTNTACSSYSLTDLGGGSVAVTCNIASVPVCTIAASSLTPATGSVLTLTAQCSDGAFGWLWTGTAAACSTSLPVCNDTQSAAGPKTYTVYGGNGMGAGPTASINVNWTAPLNPPTGCTVTRTTPASGTLPTGGGAITLNAACTGGAAPTSWEWRKNGAATTVVTAAYQETLPANPNAAAITYNYDARPCVGGTCHAWTTPVTTVVVSGTAPVGFCSQYSDVRFADIVWGPSTTLETHNNGAINPGTLYVVRINVPAGAQSPGNYPGTIEAVEFPDAPAERVVSLSSQPCDFRGFSPGMPSFPPGDATGANGPLTWSGGNVVALSFLFTGDPQPFPPIAQLNTGQTYYLNVQTIRASDGLNSCNAPSCNLKFVLRPPN
jgi:hypothetical protein